MTHGLWHRLATAALVFIGASALAQDQWLLYLPTGGSVEVLDIRETTLHLSDEKAFVLTYQSTKSFDDMDAVAAEAERVWPAFEGFVDKRDANAAVVEASEPPVAEGVVRRRVGWVWKRHADGKWHRPEEGDRALAPK